MGNLAQRVQSSSFFCGGVPYPPVSRLDFSHSAAGYLPNCSQKNRRALPALVLFFCGTISTDRALH